MLGNAATHGAFAVLSTGEVLHPELQPLHYDRANSLSTHDMSREELMGATSATFDLSDFAGNPISTSKIILARQMTVNGPGGFTDSNMGGGIPPGSTGRRPFADHSNQQAPNLGLANRDGQTSRLAAQTRQYEGMYAPPTQGGMDPLTGDVSWHEELTAKSKN
eukprot:scaffold139585_cov223-Phaeocystis_antarctica.AAC.1